MLEAHSESSSLWQGGDDAREQGLKVGLMTPPEAIPTKHKEWLSFLTQ